MPRRRDKIGSLITHRYPLQDVVEAFGVAATPQSAKVMIEFDAALIPTANPCSPIWSVPATSRPKRSSSPTSFSWRRTFPTPIRSPPPMATRSEEHTSELQSLMRISYAVFCLKNKKKTTLKHDTLHSIQTQHTTCKNIQHINNT